MLSVDNIYMCGDQAMNNLQNIKHPGDAYSPGVHVLLTFPMTHRLSFNNQMAVLDAFTLKKILFGGMPCTGSRRLGDMAPLALSKIKSVTTHCFVSRTLPR